MKNILCLLVLFTLSFTNAVTAQNDAFTTPQTSIEFDEPTFQWGEIMEGEIIQNVFTFTNTGSEPLIITNAKGSCGCTVPEFPKEPIMPGEMSYLLVKFDSKNKGKVEGASQSKRVTISANTDPVNTYLTIKGMVFKPEVETEKLKEEISAARNAEEQLDRTQLSLFPNPTRGNLNVSFNNIESTSGHIEIYNGQGQRLLEKESDDLENEMNFDLSQYPPGTYTVNLKVEGKNRIAKRFVILGS
jgi:hypothetical protein